MKDRSCRKRLALVGILTWFSCHQYERTLFADAAARRNNRSNGPSIQHRVKRSHRRVDYVGTSRGTTSPGVRRNVRSRGTSSTTEAKDDRWELRKEIHSEDIFWVFHAPSSNKNNKSIPQQQEQQQQQQKHDYTSGTRRSLLRYLYDQFVGEELPPSDSLGSGTTNELISDNLTTGVDFGSIVEANASAIYHNPESSNTFNSDITATTTTTTGEGNSTESVVYTTVNEDLSQSNSHSGRMDDSTTDGPIHNNNNNNNNNYINEGIADSNNNDAADNNNNNSTNATHGARDAEPQFQPLRMRAILVEDSHRKILRNDTEREILFHEMLSPALLAWSSSLRVDPVVGNLTVDVHQLVDGATCGPGVDSGLPSIRVPTPHIEEGIPETDMIVYLSLGFSVPGVEVEGDNNNNDNNETDAFFDTVDFNPESFQDDDDDHADGSKFRESYLGLNSNDEKPVKEKTGGGFGDRIKEYMNSEESGADRRSRDLTTVRNGDGDDDEDDDVVESSSAFSSSTSPAANAEANGTAPINICTGEYLAAASYCSTDQFDRPTAALLHICIDDSFFDARHRRRNIMTLVHELGHALGFNALSMAHFRRPDGTPYTPRDEDGNVPDATVECTGPEDEHQTATLPLPSEEILRFRNVRGGVRVAEIVTPSVVQVVRNQFDCQLLTGAELESSEGSPLSITGDGAGCIGDHWERRLFSSDVMNPIVDDIEYSTRISTLTLAYFADSGWYQVDLSNADVASGWGRGAGCQFVNDTCINEYGDVPPQNAPFFCNEVSFDRIPGLSAAQNIHGCTPDLSRKARCSIGEYDLDLPKAYQYFNSTYGSKVGGSDTFMDFCPVYDGYDNGLCSSTESGAVIRASEIEQFGLRNSRCLVGNVYPFYRNTALCLPIACVLEDRTLRVKVGDDWHICEHADKTIESETVKITCPDPRRICPTFFCPYDCLGTGGECDYNSGKCLCRYENATEPGQTFLDVCGIEEETEELEIRNTTASTTTLRPILHKKGKIDSLMPPADTKISDYYVSDVYHLDSHPRLIDAWGVLILSITALVLVSFFVVLFVFRKPLLEGTTMTWNIIRFWKRKRWDPRGDDGIGRGGSIHGSTREKHKMVASVLVDMRIRQNDESNGSRWRRRGTGRRDLNESLDETDGRMTDSEIGSSAAPAMSDSLSEISSRQMNDETMSDFEDGDENNVSVNEEEASHLPQEPAVMRRRRFVS